MKTVKIGVIGVGQLGYVHAVNIRYRVKGAELVAISSRNAERVSAVQRELDIPCGYTSYIELLQNNDLDAILIASSTAAHKEHILASIKYGKHVFVEKPTGIDVAECLEIENAVKQGNRHFMVGFMRRYDPSYVEAKKRIEAGEIGQPIFYRGYSLDPVWIAEYLAKRADLNGCWFLDMGVHDYDLARWFLQSDAESVFACGGAYAYPVFDKTNDIDNGFALLKFANKTAAFIYPGRTAPHGSHVETEIIGTKGSIRIGDDPIRNHVKVYNTEGVVQKCYQGYQERWNEAFYLEVQAFVDGILKGNPQGPTAHDGTMATMMGLTVQKSYVSGGLEKFDALDL